jgi:hypothetical protein
VQSRSPAPTRASRSRWENQTELPVIRRLRAGEIIIEIAAFLPVSSWRIVPILWDHVG